MRVRGRRKFAVKPTEVAIDAAAVRARYFFGFLAGAPDASGAGGAVAGATTGGGEATGGVSSTAAGEGTETSVLGPDVGDGASATLAPSHCA
jgi:hypothetical protein